MKASTIASRSSRRLLSNPTTVARQRLLSSSSLSRSSAINRVSHGTKQSNTQVQHRQAFSTTISKPKGLSPDSSEPKTPNTESHPSSSNAQPTEISESEYHEIADQYLNSLVLALEEKAEDSSLGMEVEYSAGVLTIGHPRGTYVLNKQPPNKQIWLSSPVSGPKRYDWAEGGAGQHEKQGSESGTGDDGSGGRWTYLRDGSGLSELLAKEVEVEIPAAGVGGSDATPGKEGPGGSGAAKLDGD